MTSFLSTTQHASQHEFQPEALLDPDTPDTLRLSVAEAQDLGERALRTLGFAQDEAATITAHLVDASCWGYEFAGLPRVLVIADRPEIRRPRLPLTIVRESPVSAMLDGGNQTGYITLLQAAEMAINKARQSGMALIGLRNSWFGGRNAYYLEKVARAGLVGIYLGSSTPTVVPPGATRKALGTNPFVISIPGDPNPLIIDMGTAAVMSGEVLMRAFLGESFPEVVGLDKEGKPTREARAMLEGGVLPFGGHKGYGISLAIQALGLLGGAKMRNGELADFGSLLIAFDPGLLMPPEQFKAELAELLEHIRTLPTQPGVTAVRIPSERGFVEREIRRRQGILVRREVVAKLRAMIAG